MFNIIKKHERFCFKCPFCGEENSFGFKGTRLKKPSKKDKEFFKEQGHELKDVQVMESWGCKKCEVGFFSIYHNYEDRYLEIKKAINKK